MKTIKITKGDLDKDNYYKEENIGTYIEYADCSVEIEANLGYVRFKKGVYVNGSIIAQAGSGIEAGWGIEAGEGIKAGLGINAGSGIEAGEGISCKLSLSFKYNLFAGTAWWKKAEGADKKVICGKLESGTIAYGDLEEIGMPEEKVEKPILKGKEVEVKFDGITYKAIIQ